jgi:hypothetical protein
MSLSFDCRNSARGSERLCENSSRDVTPAGRYISANGIAEIAGAPSARAHSDRVNLQAKRLALSESMQEPTAESANV